MDLSTLLCSVTIVSPCLKPVAHPAKRPWLLKAIFLLEEPWLFGGMTDSGAAAGRSTEGGPAVFLTTQWPEKLQ